MSLKWLTSSLRDLSRHGAHALRVAFVLLVVAAFGCETSGPNDPTGTGSGSGSGSSSSCTTQALATSIQNAGSACANGGFEPLSIPACGNADNQVNSAWVSYCACLGRTTPKVDRPVYRNFNGLSTAQ